MINDKTSKKQIPWNKGIRTFLDLEEISRRHWEEGFSLKDIAKELGVNDRLVSLRLKEAGYKVRSRKHSPITKQKISKTLKEIGFQPREIYKGEPWNKGLKGVQEPWNKGLVGVQESNKKGLTYEEMYGKERSEIYKEQIREKRKTQVIPVKDTSIEVRMAEALETLGIKFYPHKYIKDIEHGYQCDFFIPVQNGIKQKTVIECDGCYFHGCKICKLKEPRGLKERKKLDSDRTKEMEVAGYRVFRFWEHDIWEMSSQDLKDTLFYL